jgi:hypothetical protein
VIAKGCCIPASKVKPIDAFALPGRWVFCYPSCTYAQSSVNDGNFHIYLMSWTNGSITTSVDGTDSGCSLTGSSVPNTAQFLIFQTQTTASGYG